MSSECLYDSGEENWKHKLHLGCGGVYLRGYVNIDHAGILASEDSALLAQNMTTISDYYARLDGDMGHLPARRETCCDYRFNAERMPVKKGVVDKIVAIQFFEHLSPARAPEALWHWRSLLKGGRSLILSVPDMIGALDMQPEHMRRHLLGSDKNKHRAWYTQETLTELLQACGYSVEMLENFHFYPAIVVRAIKK